MTVFPRPMSRINPQYGFFIINSEDTQNKVDSTEVRRKIKNSENIDKYLNKKISEYIVQNGLYLDNEDDIIEE